METTRTLPVVSTRMRRLLAVTLVLLSILVIDSIYLSSVSFYQWFTGTLIEDELFQYLFLGHLLFGTIVILPLIVFIALHVRRAYSKPNRIAVRLGLSLLATVIILFVSGILLTRGLPAFELQADSTRAWLYWLHVLAPIAAVWLFLLHRLVGPRIRWRNGALVLVTGLACSVFGVIVLQDGSERVSTPTVDFIPSLASTASGGYLESHELMQDEYCGTCHQDHYSQWATSVHRFASFNNPAYTFSVNNTRDKVLERDGNVHAARFCAGCHDPVLLFTGTFDDPSTDFAKHPFGKAGITCLGCHAIQEIGSVRGNADYVIAGVTQYPFTYKDNDIYRWLNALLISSHPDMHKTSMLKPFHNSAEFCSTCHKVHLPEELNHYKWLRGQNHYDSYLLSGFSGHGVGSLYYPPKAINNCNECHMPLESSNDVAAEIDPASGQLAIHNHQFPSANTAIPHLVKMNESVIRAHQDFLENTLRVDIFGLNFGKDIDTDLIAPIRPTVPELIPGRSYVLNVVVRNLKVGHVFTQGTSDSNEVWLEVDLKTGGKPLGESGKVRGEDGAIDPRAHFLNAYVVDRSGARIAERNAEDIFTKLYDHQIKPGSAAVVHYEFEVPEDLSTPIEISVALNYRKFDTTYMKAIFGEEFRFNDLPISTIARDKVIFPLAGKTVTESQTSPVEPWMRWNDYGIGMLLKPERSALTQAESAFNRVAELGRGEGPLNLARVFIQEGRIDEARISLGDATEMGAYPWSIAWFGGIVDLQNGYFEEAIEKFDSLLKTEFHEARVRGFDFSQDYNLVNTRALAIFERSKLAQETTEREIWLKRSAEAYLSALKIDPENLTAHYGLVQVYERLDQPNKAKYHRTLHERYRVDDNAKDVAIANARRNDEAANAAAEAVTIYDLQRTP